MSRDIPTTITSVVQAAANRPVELYEVYLDTGTLYYAQDNTPFVLGVQTYTPLGVGRSPVRTSVELEVDQVEVRLDNVDRAAATRVIATDFIGRRLVIRKAFRENVASGMSVTIFDGRMDEPVITQQQLSVKVRSYLDALHQYVPRRVYSTMCNYQLYDGSCTVSKTVGTNLTTGTAIGSSTASTLVATVLSGFADNYWGPIGTLTIKAGSNNGIGREVIGSSQSSNSATVRIGFPYTINSGEVFSLARGCRKTIADCASRFGNFLNYGGYHTIPKAPQF